MVGIFFSTKLNIPQTQLGLPRLRSSLRNATTWLADRLYQLDRWIVYHLLYCQHHYQQHYMTTSPTSPHDYKQARSPSRPGSSSLESWGEFACFPFFVFSSLSSILLILIWLCRCLGVLLGRPPSSFSPNIARFSASLCQAMISLISSIFQPPS